MFSDHLQKVDQVPQTTRWLAASGLVIVCQLVAMALVAGEQVQKAQIRDNSDASRQAAVTSCVETSRGEAVKSCFVVDSSKLKTRNDIAVSEVTIEAPTLNAVTKSLMSVSLDTP